MPMYVVICEGVKITLVLPPNKPIEVYLDEETIVVVNYNERYKVVKVVLKY